MTPNVSLGTEAPRISVVIVTYRRRDVLADSLRSAVSQDYGNKEIILVDNNSGDGTTAWVRTHFPDVRVLELDHNGGACRGRNAGIRMSTGEIIVAMDDDVYFDSPSELTKIGSAFQTRPQVHVLACQLLDRATGEIRDREWCHPRSRKEFGNVEFETNFFVEGSCAFRREVFALAGFFYEPMFVGGEGHDLVLRILEQGFRMIYLPEFRMRHQISHRPAQRPYHIYTRNYIWTAFKNYSLIAGLRFALPKLLMMLVFSIRAGHWKAYLRGLHDGVCGFRTIGRERTPVHASTIRYYKQLDSFRPGILTRLARHRDGTQI